MGWYLSPTTDTPNKKGTICAGNCSHVDCAANRKFVQSDCQICGKPIGEGSRIYFVGDGIAEHAVCLELIESIEPEAVAKKFAEVLKEWLTPVEMELVIRRNQNEDDEMVCHSHDFCDSNMAMLKAVETVFGGSVDVGGEKVMGLFNAAWDIAKKNQFFKEA